MLELLEGFCDISRHGEVDLAIAVVPVQRDSDITFSSPIRCYLVVLFESVFEVESMLSFCVHYFEGLGDVIFQFIDVFGQSAETFVLSRYGW